MITIEYGDILEFQAPRNPSLDQKRVLVTYVDSDQVEGIDDTGQTLTFPIEKKRFTEESIETILLLSRADEKGYARQNGLLPEKWVTIQLGGDLPMTLHGQIVDLEEDMIQIKTYPDDKTIYIDFAYRGIPKSIPIESIALRDPPRSASASASDQEAEEGQDAQLMEDSEDIPDEKIQQFVIDAQDITFGELLEEIQEVVQVSESERRYDIESQTQDLLDEMMSHIPDRERTHRVMDQLHRILQRFRELYTLYSKTQRDGTITRTSYKGKDYRPLVNALMKMNAHVFWLLPVNRRTNTFMKRSTLQYVTALMNIESAYYGKQLDGDNLYVSYMKTMLNGINSRKVEPSPLLTKQHVQSATTMLIENIDTLQTEVLKKKYHSARNYVMERYGLGIKRPLPIPHGTLRLHPLETSERANTNENDKVNISSMVMLNYPAMEFTRAFLPNTSMLTRVNLRQQLLSSYLNDSQMLTQHTVNTTNAMEGISYERDGVSTFLTDLKHIVLDDSITDNKYETFLNAMIPRTLELFKFVEPMIQNKLSLSKILESLEPFFIYHDDLTFTQYKQMTTYMNQALKEWKRQYEQDKSIRQPLRGLYVGTLLLRTLLGRAILAEYAVENVPNVTGWASIMGQDGGGLLYSSIAFRSKDLHNQDLTPFVEQMATLEEPQNIRIAKEYTSMDALKADEFTGVGEVKQIEYSTTRDLPSNKSAIVTYFNQTYPGKQMDELKKIMYEEMRGKYKDPYTGELLSGPELDHEINVLLEGKRYVREGDYAILRERRVYQNEEGEDIVENAEPEYYIRKNQRWKPVDISQMTVLDMDTQQEAIEHVANQMIRQFEQQSQEEQDRRQRLIDQLYQVRTEQLAHTRVLSKKQQHANHERVQALANQWKESHHEYVKSPYQAKFQQIMGEEDFVLRQEALDMFVTKFTHRDDSNEHYFLCNETRVPLVPVFLYTLSKAYNQGGSDMYQQTMEELVRTQGVLSDDGGMVVDKHTGYPIRLLEFSTDEGYDERGFAVNSREVLQQPAEYEQEDVQSTLGKLEASSDIHKQSLRVMDAMLNHLQIVNSFKHEQVTILTHVYDNTVMTLDKLVAQKKLTEGDKRYTIFKYEMVFYLSLAYMTTMLESMAVRVKRTFPGCVQSFKGYPLQGEDTSAIQYMACVANKIKSKSGIWQIIMSKKEDAIAERIKHYMDKFVVENSRFMAVVRTQVNSVMEESIPEETSVATVWTTFLPPLSQPNLTLDKISTKTIRKQAKEVRGTSRQHTLIGLIQGLIIHHSLALQDEIHKVVRKEKELLLTSKGVPYIQNVCCEGKQETYAYFVERNDAIASENKTVQKLTKMLEMFAPGVPMVSDPQDTKLKYPPVSHAYTEETIYRAFIKFCQYNRGIPLDEEMATLCQTNQSAFQKQDSIERKIEILKEEGVEFSSKSLEQLLDILHRQNYVNIPVYPSGETCRTPLETILRTLEEEDDELIDLKLRTSLQNALDTYDMSDKGKNDAQQELYDYVVTANKAYKKELMQFMKSYEPSRDKYRKQFKEAYHFVDNLESWKNHETELGSFMNTQDTTVNYLRSFFENAILLLGSILPTMVLGKEVSKKETIRFPTHWKLGQVFNDELAKSMWKYYEPLNGFVGEPHSNHMHDVLNAIVKQHSARVLKHHRLLDLLRAIPLLSDVGDASPVFDANVVKQLYIHGFYSVLISYIRTNDTIHPRESDGLGETERQTKTKSLAYFMFVMLSRLYNAKRIVNVNYEEIYAKILEQREKEKKRMTDKFENLSTDQLRSKNMKKNLRIDEFSAGEQAGLFRHQQAYALGELTEIVDELDPSSSSSSSEAQPGLADVFAMDMMAEDQAQREIDREEYSMSGLPDDDDYGDRDGDEQY